MELQDLYQFVQEHPTAKIVRLPYDQYQQILAEIPESFCQHIAGWPMIVWEGVVFFGVPESGYYFHSRQQEE